MTPIKMIKATPIQLSSFEVFAQLRALMKSPTASLPLIREAYTIAVTPSNREMILHTQREMTEVTIAKVKIPPELMVVVKF